MKTSELKSTFNSKIKDLNYNMLTKIANEGNDISIYIIDQDGIIREVLINIISEKEYISLNLIGELTKDEVMELYKTVDFNNLEGLEN